MPFKYRCLLLITPLIFVADQLTKWLVRSRIAYGSGIPVIPGYFDIVHVHNTGAAFGMLAGAQASFREPFFYLVSLVAIGVIATVLRKLPSHERLLPIVLTLILGGVLGNTIDRVAQGFVTDFLSVHWRDVVLHFSFLDRTYQLALDWPSFNVADSAITVSMVLLAWQGMRAPHTAPKKNEEAAS